MYGNSEIRGTMAHNDSCINPGCGRAFPQPVDFCPWCGTAQRPVNAVPAPPVVMPTVLPVLPVTPAPPVPPAPVIAAPVVQPPPAPKPIPAPAPSVPPAPPVPPVRANPAPRLPVPTRKPIRLRWWLVGLGLLWLAWMLTKPTAARIERRMASAVALAKECKPKDAQDELIALRKTRATPEQLRQVQSALNTAAAACTRAEQRRAAWTTANNAIERLLNAGSFEQARTRLATFTKRWGEDARTREVKARIDAGRRDHPLADPSR
jgi:outer membrane biosynthesis protein TonB